MREILFRGKRIDNGDWIVGNLSQYPCRENGKFVYSITTVFMPPTRERVVLESIGQYTGLTDKNGTKIFERDIIRANHDGAIGVVRFGEYMSPSDPDLTRHIGYYVDWQGKEKDFLRADLGYWASRSDVEVIGNIYDNPELLEVQDD